MLLEVLPLLCLLVIEFGSLGAEFIKLGRFTSFNLLMPPSENGRLPIDKFIIISVSPLVNLFHLFIPIFNPLGFFSAFENMEVRPDGHFFEGGVPSVGASAGGS